MSIPLNITFTKLDSPKILDGLKEYKIELGAVITELDLIYNTYDPKLERNKDANYLEVMAVIKNRISVLRGTLEAAEIREQEVRNV